MTEKAKCATCEMDALRFRLWRQKGGPMPAALCREKHFHPCKVRSCRKPTTNLERCDTCNLNQDSLQFLGMKRKPA